MDQKVGKYQYIVVALTYRNSNDLKDFLPSVYKHFDNVKVIIVNSYYDEKTKSDIEAIANEYACDFLSVPNKGYSYGNNRGIEYALQNYCFEYLIISNPDIIVKKVTALPHPGDVPALYGSVIVNARGKRQNPLQAKKNSFSSLLIYKGFKNKCQAFLMMGIVINRLTRELYLLFKKFHMVGDLVYALHGSFVVFSYAALKKLGLPYDENLFLFAEECVLADKAIAAGINSYLTDAIEVYHKEDGSMNFESDQVYNNLRNANIYYYENYRMRK